MKLASRKHSNNTNTHSTVSYSEVELETFTPLDGQVLGDAHEEFYAHIHRAPALTDSRRCLRCGLYYVEKDSTDKSCSYHPGKFSTVLTVHSFGASSGKWTCCAGADVHAPGCKTGRHLEDRTTSEILNHFNGLAQDASPLTPSISSTSTPTQIPEKQDDKDKDDVKFVKVDDKLHLRHPVALTDTLAGIALKYGTKAAYLRQINKLVDDNHLYSRSHLLVPCPANLADTAVLEEQEQKIRRNALEKKFQRENGVSREEAVYYLDEAQYNYDEATKVYKEDLEFEKKANNAPKTKRTKQ